MLPPDMPEGARAIAEQLDIAACAERLREDYADNNLAVMSEVIAATAGSILPKYSNARQTTLEAIEAQTGHCLHRAAVIHAIAIQVPDIRAAIAVRSSHAYNLLVSQSGQQAVSIENSRHTVPGADPGGVIWCYKLDLSQNPDSTQDNYVMARLLLGLTSKQMADFRRTFPTRLDECLNRHVITDEEARKSKIVVPNTKLYVGASALEFIARTAKPLGVTNG